MARTKLTSGLGADDVTAYATASVTVGANSMVLAFVTSGRAGFAGTAPSPPTITLGAQPMTQVNSVANGDRRLSCFQFMATQAVSDTLAIDFNGEQQDYCAWSVFAYDGVDTASPVGQSSTTTGANSNTLTVNLPGAPQNASAAAIIMDAAVTVDPAAGLSEVDEVVIDQLFLGRDATLETADAPQLIGDPSWTWSAPANSAALAVEIKLASSGGSTAAHPDEPLIRRFEPVLFLHDDEKFMPSDPKRFIEKANLWTTGTPPYDNATWGVGPTSGGVFPRTPRATEVAARPGEPGLDLATLTITERRSSFLELGGWNDEQLNHESAVTTVTQNRYSDRGAIQVLYEGELKDSQLWYHAEVFDAARLSTLAGARPAPNLRPVLDQLTDPILLCYYLFFPAHEQTVECTSTPGAEVSSHAGDWQCVAILLQRDPSGDAALHQPRYLGLTGSRPSGDVAYAFDDDERTVMKVAPWSTGGPGVTAVPQTTVNGRRLHPHVYVSLGSHSLYPTPGAHDTDPYLDSAVPHDCGGSDSVSITPPPPVDPGESNDPSDEGDVGDWLFGISVFLLKTIGGVSGGGALGIAAPGLVGGMLTGAKEWIDGVSPPFAVVGPETPSADTPTPDTGPTSGTGKTITPVGLVVPEAGPTVLAWQVQQGKKDEATGRVYDYVVDRDQDVWLPHDDGERGYRGRWGQRVTNDTLPRRAGPRFPDYPTMFLTALADLNGK
jgi:hypothetical protein